MGTYGSSRLTEMEKQSERAEIQVFVGVSDSIQNMAITEVITTGV